MYEANCSQVENSGIYPRHWNIDELEARAGALVNVALKNWSNGVKQVHWEDMKQTAMLAFLEHQEKTSTYAYAAADTALKNYKWVHIRALNGGWKSLAARSYSVSELSLELDGDSDSPPDSLYWRLPKEKDVPRPVEWKVIALLDGLTKLPADKIFLEILYILAGMSNTNWYPEQIYRAASVISKLLNEYTWEDVETQTGMDSGEVWTTWWHYRKTRISPYIELSPMHQEIVKLLGRERLVLFEELSFARLNQPFRKMVVLPDGIYTITYKRRGRRRDEVVGQMEGSLQKGRRVNGRPVVRAISLGRVGEITKARLLESSLKLECKLKYFQDIKV